MPLSLSLLLAGAFSISLQRWLINQGQFSNTIFVFLVANSISSVRNCFWISMNGVFLMLGYMLWPEDLFYFSFGSD